MENPVFIPFEWGAWHYYRNRPARIKSACLRYLKKEMARHVSQKFLVPKAIAFLPQCHLSQHARAS